jgi:hypothetical protein
VNGIKPRPEWFKHAACVGSTELFFPEVDDPHKVDTAKEAANICRTECRFVMECVERTANEPVGVWGGLTVEQRRNYWHLRRQKGMSPQDAWPLAAGSSRANPCGVD